MKRSEVFFTLILIPFDFLAIFLAFMFSYRIREKINVNPDFLGRWSETFNIESFEILPDFSLYLKLSLIFALVIIMIFAVLGLYQIKSSILNFKELPKVILAVSSGVTFIVLVSFFLRTFLLPRLIVLFFWFLAFLLVVIGRLFIRIIQRSLYRYGIGVVRIGILGHNGLSQEVIESLSSLRGFKINRKFNTSDIDLLISDIKAKKIDQLLVADYSLADDLLRKLRERCINSHVRFTYVPNLFEVTASRVEVHDLNGLPIVEVKTTSLDGWGRVAKRLFDILVSFLSLIIFLPLLVLIMIGNKILNPGPIFFWHRRLGITGREIKILKFRTMKWAWCDDVVIKGKSGLERFGEYLEKNPQASKEWREKQKLSRDPRLSTFGTFLRVTNLDELPQLANVLKGDLSLVGPRPIITAEKEKYGNQSGRLFTIKPGLTGLWQVSGRNDLSYKERVKLDIIYVENWSFWLDLTIIFRTIGLFFSKRGAY